MSIDNRSIEQKKYQLAFCSMVCTVQFVIVQLTHLSIDFCTCLILICSKRKLFNWELFNLQLINWEMINFQAGQLSFCSNDFMIE